MMVAIMLEGPLVFPYCMDNTSHMWFSESGKGAGDRKLIIGRSFFIWGRPPPYSSFMHQSDNLLNHQYHVISKHFLGVVSYIA